jgi:hypothetical protein
MIGYTNGLERAQGLKPTECDHWDLNDLTRAFNNRIKDKGTLWPNMSQFGNYSKAMHHIKRQTTSAAPGPSSMGPGPLPG